MLKLALCDDDKSMEQRVRGYLSAFSISYNQDIELAYYPTASELLRAPFDYQLLLLDIMLEKGNDGIMIGRRLRKMGNKALFILCTSRTDRYLEGYALTTFRYLVKPLEQEAFFTMLRDAIEHLAVSERTFPIRYNKKTDMLFLSEIIYIESYMRKRFVHTANGSYQTTDTWESIRAELDGEFFFSPQRAFLINLAHVRATSRKQVTLSNGKSINFSKGRYEEFNRCFNDFLGNLR